MLAQALQQFGCQPHTAPGIQISQQALGQDLKISAFTQTRQDQGQAVDAIPGDMNWPA
jgi:hypothetical protein